MTTDDGREDGATTVGVPLRHRRRTGAGGGIAAGDVDSREVSDDRPATVVGPAEHRGLADAIDDPDPT